MSGTLFRLFSRFILTVILFAPQSLHAEPGAVSNTPISGTAVFTTSTESIDGGARIKANFHHAKLGSQVTLTMIALVTDANGRQEFVELKRIDDSFEHSTTEYRTERSFEINYDHLNAELKQMAPSADLKIGPGTKLYLFARWMNIPSNNPYDQGTWGGSGKPQWNHYYGGISRSGEFVLPQANPGTSQAPTIVATAQQSGFTKGGITTALDVAHPFDQATKNKYPGLNTPNSSAGSRFEKELKLHAYVHSNQIPKIEKYLAELAADPKKVEARFGVGWSLKENRKYVGSPMIDVYMDNKLRQAAQIGMALRERTGSGVTNVNYKPDDGRNQGDGSTERIEYELNGVSSLAAVKDFMDSDHPANAFQLIREKIPGATPSEFAIRVVNLNDIRLKYELTAPSGDQVEISLDHVRARQLDPQEQMFGPTAEWGSVEVEVNHLGVKGSATTQAGQGVIKKSDEWSTLFGADKDTFMASLSAGANMHNTVPYQFHGQKDFDANSPLKVKNAANFALSKSVFDKLREDIFGSVWNYSGQKYAVAAAALGMIQPDQFAPSVNDMLEQQEGRKNLTPAEKMTCLLSMVKLVQ